MADRKLIPLSLLAAADDGVVEGSTRLQKLVFLVQEDVGRLPEGRYDYFSYDYGPFSEELATDLESMVERGWIDVEERPATNGPQYVYRLTEDGRRVVEEMAGESSGSASTDGASGPETGVLLDHVRHVEDVFNHMPVSNLLEYVHINYEEYTAESVLEIS